VSIFFVILFISLINSTFGEVRHRDCSVASCAILVNLSIFLSFDCLIIDLSAGRKYILFIHSSESFCVINSAFDRLFGIAIAMIDSLFVSILCVSVFVIFQNTVFVSNLFN
jgi:hypothetical protein